MQRSRECLLGSVFCLAVTVSLSAQDINMDGHLDCADTELLGDAILSGNNDPRYDLDGNGVVELADHQVWRDAVDTHWEDVNLDGYVDQRDHLVFALNFGHEHPYGVCRGDIDLNGISNRSDNDVNSYNPPIPFPATPSTIEEIPNGLTIWNGSGEATIARSERFQLVAVPTSAPDGLLATKIFVRTDDPNDLVSIFHHVIFSGDLHQVWIPGQFGQPPTPTPNGFNERFRWNENVAEEEIAQLNAFDSHFNVNPYWGLRKGTSGFDDENDTSNPANLTVVLEGEELEFPSGIGPLYLEYHEIGVQALQSPFHLPVNSDDVSMSNEFELAYLVTPARMPDTNQPGEVFGMLGVGGASADLLPFDDLPIFGRDETLQIPFFAVPCDTDADGRCDHADLQRVVEELGNEAPEYDLDLSNSPIDENDIQAWLNWYGTHYGVTVVPGDADLDGDVDSADLNQVGVYWLQHDGGWIGGDFNSDGITNSADLNALGANWQFRASATAVPEPELNWFLIGGWVTWVISRRELQCA